MNIKGGFNMELYIIPVSAVAVGLYSYQKAKRNRVSQAIGFAFLPGLWFGSFAWCLLTGQFGLVFLILALAGAFLTYLHFFAE